jgi:D-3-phosphoglycerate dehydrogenase / 2-oxoglutarate reductase
VGGAPVVLLSERLGPVTEVESRLEGLGALVRAAPLWSRDEIRRHGEYARIIILGAVEPFGADALAELANVHAIVRRGVGTDNVDLDAATGLGIIVANVPDASVEEVSDHALALLVAIERQLAPLDAGVRAGLWARDPRAIQAVRAPIRRLATLTLGVVGFGKIGRALVRKAANLYDRVIVHDPAVQAAPDVDVTSLPDLLAQADHVSIHAPLTDQTRHLIDAAALGRMRPGAVLVNTSRGGLVDEDALLQAVSDGSIRGAGLDVTEAEPLPPTSPLLKEPRILLTAHSAASSDAANVELARRSVDAAAAILQGLVPDSVANAEVLDHPALRAALSRGG